MSLRTKMMLSIFVFLVLVFGLLTLNLWIGAASKDQTERKRNADLVARMAGDLVQAWTAPHPAWDEEAWAEVSRKMVNSQLVERWTIASRNGGKMHAVVSNERDPEAVLQQDAALFSSAFEGNQTARDGARIYMPLLSPQGERFAARLDVRSSAVPAAGIGETMRGILTVMALGTALLLLNIYVFTNRLVLRPLDSLIEASNRVAAGDFSKKIPEDGTYDEMGRMVGAFNLMIDKIAEYHRALQADIRDA